MCVGVWGGGMCVGGCGCVCDGCLVCGGVCVYCMCVFVFIRFVQGYSGTRPLFGITL